MAKKTKPKALNLSQILTRYYGSMLTPKQMRQQARKDTNLAMQDSMRTLRTTYQRERERTLREQYAQGAYAGLLRGYGAEGSAEAQSIRDAYARAAGLTGAEQRGFITPTIAQQATNVAGSQAAAENLAGYTGDVATISPGDVTGAQQPGANAAVLNYLSSLPAGTFAAEAESAAKGLASAGARAAGPFALRAAELGQGLREMQDEYTMAVRDLQAKRGGLFQEALGGYRESGRGDFATLINAMYLQNTIGKTEAELTGTYKGKPTQAALEQAAATKIANAKLLADIAESNESLKIRWTNARTAQERARIAKQQLAIDKAGSQGDLVKLEQEFREGAQKYLAKVINVNPKLGRPLRRPPSKQALVNAVMRIFGGPLIGKYGLAKPQLVSWAQQVVASFPDSYWQVKSGGKGAGKGGKSGVVNVEE